KPANEPLKAVEDELLRNLASQAGLVMRNVGLNQEVLARLEELKASRQRLVAAQDEARRRLERNLHDGAQQHLVALKVQLSLVERVADSDKVKRMLKKVASDADDALEALRDLARGIYPPLLADQGLAAALEAQAQKAPIPVHVHADNVSRHSEDEEAAVYFCCLEALQNAAKHAQASTAEIDLVEKEDVLAFCVRDNGRGFDLATTPQGDGLLNMADRLEAMGGTLEVRSSHEDGTSVTGQLPLQPLTTHQGSH
ncbi:MAG TPA: histidine kinase, partial [Actinomycetota bacterium]|nr:histidine kinase [Actinomycetota bacterium]